MSTGHDVPQQVAELLRDAFGAQAAMLLYTAAKMNIAEHLTGTVRSAQEIARAAKADPRAMERILRALAVRGLCEEVAEGEFRLTDLGSFLRSDHPDSIRARVLLNVEVHHTLWASLPETVKSGDSASVRTYGLPFYDFLASNQAAGELFDRAMMSAGWVRQRFRAAIDAYDFSGFRSIVDIGGGNGAFLLEILKSAPGVRGTVVDLPRLEAGANELIVAVGLQGRCHFTAANAFDAVPAEGDVYLFSNFLNSWGDGDATAILRTCRAAMSADARLLVIDWVMPGADRLGNTAKGYDAVTMDLVMLSAFGASSGRIRTFNEFERLLAGAGLAVTARKIPTRASIEVIEARRADL